MNDFGVRRGLLTIGLCAATSWAALSPAAFAPPSRAAMAATAATCARPSSGSISAEAQGTPISSIAATPVSGSGIAPSADQQLLNDQSTSEIEQLVAAVAACQTAGDYKTLATLLTPAYIKEVYGSGTSLSASEFIQLGGDLPAQNVVIQSVSDVRVDAKGVISADVVSTTGHQLLHGRWTFIAQPDKPGDDTGISASQTNGTYSVDGLTPLAVTIPAGTQQTTIKISDTAFGTTKISGKRGGDLVLTGTNSGKQDHELLVLRLPKSMRVADLLLATGPKLPDGVVFIGQVTITAKTSGQLVLTNMPRGSYVVVDMLPDADGIPYLSHGFVANLSIS